MVRSSLALSMCTGTPFRIEKIRAGRAKPGLMRQHLTAVKAAATICSAQVEGDAIGSTALSFAPGPGSVTPGKYQFAVGTAGSATLVLQTVLPTLLCADGPSELVLEGGTHNPAAPPFDFLEKVYLPLVNRMGPRVEAKLERWGFYPAGGGRFTVTIEPVKKLGQIELMERGEIERRAARAVIANLPAHVAERELKVIAKRMNWDESMLNVEILDGTFGPGNVLMLELHAANASELITAFGEYHVTSEAVAERAVDELRRYLAADVPVGEHLADQIMLPMALAGGGAFRTLPLSRHSTTHIDLIRRFLDLDVQVTRDDQRRETVRITT